MKELKSLILIIFSASLICISSSFSDETNNRVIVSEINAIWSLNTTVDGIEFYHKKIAYADEVNGLNYEVILLKLVNTNCYKVDVSFNQKLWNGIDVMQEGTDDETLFKTTLGSKKSINGNPNVSNNLQIYVQDFVHDGGKVLSEYELVNVKVTK